MARWDGGSVERSEARDDVSRSDRFWSLLTAEQVKELGPINPNWFEDISFDDNSSNDAHPPSNATLCEVKPCVSPLHTVMSSTYVEDREASLLTSAQKEAVLDGSLAAMECSLMDPFQSPFPLDGTSSRIHSKTPPSRRIALSLGVDQTNVSWTSSLATPVSLSNRHGGVTSDMGESTEKCQTAVCRAIATPCSSASTLKRTTKRFSYPSANQIAEICPQRVFNLEARSVTSLCSKPTVETSLNRGQPLASLAVCSRNLPMRKSHRKIGFETVSAYNTTSNHTTHHHVEPRYAQTNTSSAISAKLGSSDQNLCQGKSAKVINSNAAPNSHQALCLRNSSAACSSLHTESSEVKICETCPSEKDAQISRIYTNTCDMKQDGVAQIIAGFTSAKGQPMRISAEARAKAESLIADVRMDDLPLDEAVESKLCNGFSLANNKQVVHPNAGYVASVALDAMLGDLSVQKLKCEKNMLSANPTKNLSMQHDTRPKGFRPFKKPRQTKPMDISKVDSSAEPIANEESSKVVKLTCTQWNEVTDITAVFCNREHEFSDEPFTQVALLANNASEVSFARPQSSAHCQELPQGIDTKEQLVTSNVSMCGGFQKANGNTVSVSEKAWKSGRHLLEEPDKALDDGDYISHSKIESGNTNGDKQRTHSQNCQSPPGRREPVHGLSTGFQTAGGKSLQMSEAALKMGQKLVSAIEKEDFTFDENGDAGVVLSHQTAANLEELTVHRNLEKSASFMEESSHQLDLVAKSTNHQRCESHMTSQLPKEVGLCTAAGRKSIVSEKSLRKANDIRADSADKLHDKDGTHNTAIIEKDVKKIVGMSSVSALSNPQCIGLGTTAGRMLNVAKGAMARATDMPSESENISTVNKISPHIEDAKQSDTFIKKADHLIDFQKFNFSHIESTAPKSANPGFCTAAGNEIAITENAIEKANAILHDSASWSTDNFDNSLPAELLMIVCQNGGEQQSVKCMELTSVNFADGITDNVSMTEQALNQVNLICKRALKRKADNINEEDTGTESEENPVKKSREKLEVPLDMACIQEGQILKDTSDNGFKGVEWDTVVASANCVADSNHTNDKSEVTQMEPFQGFTTAKGNRVAISEKSLATVRGIVPNEDIQTDIPTGNSFGGFRIAKGNKVEVSEMSLAAVRGIFSEKDLDMERPREDSFAGFTTAKGRKVEVSEKSLAAVRGIICEDVPEMEPPNENSFAGFTTAKGRRVEVSKKSLDAVRGLISEQDRDMETARESPRTGFTTAKGRKVDVSEKSLAAVRGIISEENHTSRNGSIHGFGFTTAKGDKVEVSETSLAAIRGDTNKETSIHATTCFQGFQTATGHKVDVSESSLHAIRNGVCLERNGKGIVQANSCFATAKGNSVSVSTATLDAVRSDPKSTPVDGNLTRQSLSKSSHKSSVKTPAKTSAKMNDSFEASESTRALLADGEFQMTPVHDRWQHCSSTPAYPMTSARKRSFNAAFPNRLIVDGSTCLSPIISLPEDAFCDRRKTRSVMRLHSVTTQPKYDSESYSEYPTDSSCSTPGGATVVKNGAFSTPYRKQPPQPTSFRTPSCKPSVVAPAPVMHCRKRIRLAEDATEIYNVKSSPAVPVVDQTTLPQRRADAREAQERHIRVKNAGSVKPVAGSLYCQKVAARGMNLRRAVGGRAPIRLTQTELFRLGVSERVQKVTAATSGDFRFSIRESFGGEIAESAESVKLKLGDAVTVIPDDDGFIGKEEFCRGLLDSDGVEPSLISTEWVHNHYRWIVWKLAAMEVAFPHTFAGRALTPDRVMLQLKYRYDKEIDHSQRSMIKKIFEKDDSPQKMMVLCVSRIVKTATECSLELTDGWYAIAATLDHPLSAHVQCGRIGVGDKLCVVGCELAAETEASSPLEPASSSTRLRLCANSTRRARWHSRLGVVSPAVARPMLLPLNALSAEGGAVDCVDVVITRVYPIQYMEKCDGGGNVFRNARAEERAAARFEELRQRHMEEIISRVQAEFEKESAHGKNGCVSRRLSRDQISRLHSGAELYDALKCAVDTTEFQASLTSGQLSSLAEHSQRVTDERQAEFRRRVADQQNDTRQTLNRNVVALLKLRVAGISTSDIDAKTVAMLTIWRPTSELQEQLTEGKRIQASHLTASQPRGSARDCVVSLTATRGTRYRLVDVDENLLDLVHEPRQLTMLSELTSNLSPTYNEVDVAVVCVHILPMTTANQNRSTGNASALQIIYVADVNGDLAAVKFWRGLDAHGVTGLVSVGSVLACSNAQYQPRGSPTTTWAPTLPVLMVTDVTAFTGCPQRSVLKSGVQQLNTLIKSNADFVPWLQEKLQRHIGGRSASLNKSPHTNHTAHNSFPSSLADSSGTSAPPLTDGCGTSSAEKLKQRAEQRKRMSRLQTYSRPPPLAALSSPIAKVARQAFKAPKQVGVENKTENNFSKQASISVCNSDVVVPSTANNVTGSPKTSDEIISKVSSVNTECRRRSTRLSKS